MMSNASWNFICHAILNFFKFVDDRIIYVAAMIAWVHEQIFRIQIVQLMLQMLSLLTKFEKLCLLMKASF